VVASGAGARGSAWVRSFPIGGGLRRTAGASGEIAGRASGFARPSWFAAERSGFESSAATRHVTIGFPPDAGGWDRGATHDRLAPVAFSGQGDEIWRTSPGRAAHRSTSDGAVQKSRDPGQWHTRIGRPGRREGFDRSAFSPRWFPWHFFPSDAFGLYSYPFYGYGFGPFSYCADWLVPDGEWQENDSGECNAYTDSESQDAAIAAYGADQTYSADQSYSAPQTDTRQIYSASADRHPSGVTAEESGLSEAANGSGSAAVPGANDSRHPDTLIYLADGTNYAVTNYWLANGDLHYLTSYGAEGSVPIERIDLQRTVDANAAQGVQFTLRPGPAAGTLGGER
jgi:hypothetical protein